VALQRIFIALLSTILLCLAVESSSQRVEAGLSYHM